MSKCFIKNETLWIYWSNNSLVYLGKMFWIKYRHLSDGSFPNMNIHATLNPKKKNKTQQPSVGLFSSPKLFIHAIRHIKHIFFYRSLLWTWSSLMCALQWHLDYSRVNCLCTRNGCVSRKIQTKIQCNIYSFIHGKE